MNKDLDERLVPNGQYRDAMNIQISTSDSSDVGAIENILGNSPLMTSGDLDAESYCVGSVADEKNNALYWLIAGPTYLGLNDTITYSFSNWSDPFNCFDNAFTSYQETCMATVTITGVNNSINLDLDNSNNYIGFNPIWDNCYDVVSVNEMLNVNKEVLGVWDFLGRYVQEDILGLEPNKPYLIRYTDGTTEKIFLR